MKIFKNPLILLHSI